MQDDVDLIIEKCGKSAGAVIPILQAIQGTYHYLPEQALRRVCEITDITPAAIIGVSTFYSQFRHQPAGKHIVNICLGTACHVKGSDKVYDALLRHLNLKNDADTDSNGLFTVQKVACLGCCTLAPVVQIDQVTYGHVTPERVPHVLDDFLKFHSQKTDDLQSNETLEQDKESSEIRIGLGSCCMASGSALVKTEIEKVLKEMGIRVPIKRVGCVGMCHQTPLLEISFSDHRQYFYAHVQPQDVAPIINRHYRPFPLYNKVKCRVSNLLDKLLSDRDQNEIKNDLNIHDSHVQAFLNPQQHLATEYSGMIDPTDLDEYRQKGGFAALAKCLTQYSPEQIIDEISRSGLRGRGGAGFSTGLKWAAVRASSGAAKYIICNGDEGDPGAFMDRMLLESYPFRIIEGMIIAAFAVGVRQGFLYIRAEYPLAVQRVQDALEKCRNAGLLGKNILQSDFSLNLEIMQGAGAFVCGEETALIFSIEGKRGMPRLRPPYPSQKGLWDFPTLVNNVETYSLIPWIIKNGVDAFSQLGTDKSKGTKVFALAGKVARGGLIEVPMGITIREIVYNIGGGIANDRQFKAVQIGGPSGGCIPAELAHLKVDYEALVDAGAMMGSGGLLVLDENDCMVDMARYFLAFTQNQSCGKCTFCRIGTRRMLDILERLCRGEGKQQDIEQLQDLAEQTKAGSLCGLGKSAPNPVLTTLRYFRHEYDAHLQGHCPAKKCQALIHYEITDHCIGCTLCAQKCPVHAIAFLPYQQHKIQDEKCTRCDTCRQICPNDAIIIES